MFYFSGNNNHYPCCKPLVERTHFPQKPADFVSWGKDWFPYSRKVPAIAFCHLPSSDAAHSRRQSISICYCLPVISGNHRKNQEKVELLGSLTAA